MRKPLLAAAAAIMLLAASAPALSAPTDTSYRLGVGDQVRLKVYDWRSAVGDLHEWTALNADFRIGPDGNLSLPLLGAVKASGSTLEELADTISTRLQAAVNLAARPQASIEVVEYRPFYILGDVTHPGEYPYRPGMTVLQAISLAGGMYRVSDPGLVFTTTGELQVLRLEYGGLLARHARLQAEFDGADKIAFPPELQQNNPEIAQLIQREQSMFAARREAVRSELEALNQLKSLLNSEVAALQAKMKNLDAELAMMRGEVANTSALVKQGLAIAPREFTLKQTELETEGRRLDLDTAALRAKEDIGKADQAIVELRNKTHIEIQVELADVERKIPETDARIKASSMILDQHNTRPGSQQPDDEGSTVYLILRPGNDSKEITAQETTPIAPGDTIKIIRPNESLAPSAANPSPDGLANGRFTRGMPPAK
jgi:exopolysaccharide production protein ExoF